MQRIREAARTAGPDSAAHPREERTVTSLSETAPCSCLWSTMAITDLAMRDVDVALAADPLFHLCADGYQGRVDVRYWYFRPLNLSCRHCSEGGGVRVVDPGTVVCRHRVARRTGEPVRER